MLVRIACWHWPCSWLCFSLSWWFNPPFPLKTNCNVSVLQMLRKTDRGICHPLQLQVSQFESKVHRLIPLIPTRSHCLQRLLIILCWQKKVRVEMGGRSQAVLALLVFLCCPCFSVHHDMNDFHHISPTMAWEVAPMSSLWGWVGTLWNQES